MSHLNKTPETNNSRPVNSQSKWIHVRWFLLRFALLVYDSLAVNASVFLAFYTRFYVANRFHTAATRAFEAYCHYWPIYTMFCILVFAVFKLYSGMWKYAGFNDLNRIVFANVATFIGHVVGTLMFGIRMPISIYCISAVIQLCLVGASRFSYRVLLTEKERLLTQNKATVNALLVGVGGTAHFVIRQMDRESVVRPVCMLNYKEYGFGALFNGIPVVSGVENLKSAVEKYHVNLVVLASTVIPAQMRNQIREICKAENIEVQDYSGYFQPMGMGITLRNVAECSKGPVEIVLNGYRHVFDDGEQALMNTEGRYIVKSISAKGNVLVVELEGHDVVLNDLNEDWVKQQKDETGEDISFF